MIASGRETATRPRTPDQEDLERLLSEWRVITDRASVDLSEWALCFDRIAAEEDALRSRGHWFHGPDDTFGVLGIQRDELPHSAMIAWLLDPCGRHGLGPTMLREFLAEAYPEGLPAALLLALPKARTRCEEQRGECRVDIVIRAGSELTLVIENKVEATECLGQCDAYFKAYRSEPGARFVFLTPDGRTPISATGSAAGAFRALSYRQVLLALDRSLETAAGVGPAGVTAEGRQVAESYRRTLKREF
ncbi:MAG: PD-(D/E)XK nuclease family protein [Deltaproteobacteria bacterium]|nr:PD-(D/E)XK nuclease family protein [Deltaproteobacteria bacterium]